MSKKTFIGGGLSTVLGDGPEPAAPKKIGRPVTQTKIITKSSQEGTKENEIRATFILNEQLLEEMKAIAYWERDLIKNVTASALEDYVSKYKKKNGGELRPIPANKK